MSLIQTLTVYAQKKKKEISGISYGMQIIKFHWDFGYNTMSTVKHGGGIIKLRVTLIPQLT